MSNRPKQKKVIALNLRLYDHELHPELFNILKREEADGKDFQADVMIVAGGHVVALSTDKHTLTEAIIYNDRVLGDRGLLHLVSCRGERYFKATHADALRYTISAQEEQLTQNLYETNREDMKTYATKRGLLAAKIPETAECGPGLSVLDVERQAGSLIIHSFHCFDDACLVFKTQSIIEILGKCDR